MRQKAPEAPLKLDDAPGGESATDQGPGAPDRALDASESGPTRIALELERLSCPIDQLDSLDGNPHRGDVEAVMRSYVRFGQRKPIVARHVGDRGEVTAGNTQLAAARELGWDRIAVVWADDDDVTAKAWALADNRTAELGLYDEEALLAFIETVSADAPELLDATGYTQADLERLIVKVTGPGEFADADPSDMATEYRCPACGYEWSGQAAPGTQVDG